MWPQVLLGMQYYCVHTKRDRSDEKARHAPSCSRAHSHLEAYTKRTGRVSNIQFSRATWPDFRPEWITCSVWPPVELRPLHWGFGELQIRSRYGGGIHKHQHPLINTGSPPSGERDLLAQFFSMKVQACLPIHQLHC